METQMETRTKGIRGLGREVFGWCVYDFGAAAFTTSVTTVFFGPFITSVASAAADASGLVHPFGIEVHYGALYPYLISISVFLQICLLPLIGALADYTRMKKPLLVLSLFGGSGSVMAMLAVGPENYLLGGGLFLLANLCFGASDVLYNAFLPEICAPEDRNRVSSFGWGLGYLGGGVLLVLQYLFIAQADVFGLAEMDAARIALASCGFWWLLFGGFALTRLESRQAQRARTTGGPLIIAGFRELRSTLRALRRYPQTLLFLAAFLLYSDGIQTVTSISTQFGQEEVGLSMEDLAQVILIVQFVGVLGAWLFERLARRFGTKRSILFSLVVYIMITLYAYGPLQTKFDFYVMAAVTALVLVGSQALSRAAFSRMIPAGCEAEYFGIYEISERGTSWLSPLFFGLALQYTGSYRIAVLSLSAYFIVGFVLLLLVKFKRAEEEAQGEEGAFPVLPSQPHLQGNS
ncbi:MAG: MFS transporter [Bacteroidetes bacterium]|nr:MFS transporter [Bacteroidota bacterium]